MKTYFTNFRGKNSRYPFSLFVLFAIAVGVRFLFFEDSVYFGFDEARDAYTSQAIYLQGDIKLVGPPANFSGLYHGPLFWYILGPIYLLGQGSPVFVSAVFRLINASGVFLTFFLAHKLFDKKTALIAALIYAFSFEQTQYAMYVGNPTLSIFCWLGLFYGAAFILKDKNPKGVVLMFASAALALQFELILAYLFAIVVVLLFLLRRNLKTIPLKIWVTTAIMTALIASSFILAEIKYHFQLTQAFMNLLRGGYSVMQPGETRVGLYLNNLLLLFHDNLISFIPTWASILLGVSLVTFLLVNTKKVSGLLLLLIWIFAGLMILPFGSYDAYYVNVGIGLGIVISFAFFLGKLQVRHNFLFILLLLIVVLSNLMLIFKNNPTGLITKIKAQHGMLLSQEHEVIDRMYREANGKEFTVRVTSMPYKIQTVWAYLFTHYGIKKWGYLPLWQDEPVMGYPGVLPRPFEGTTCLRYLVREPVRGIPQNLIDKDIEEENLFSDIISEEKFGDFILEIRHTKGECHD